MEAFRTGTRFETWLQRTRAVGSEPTVTAFESVASAEGGRGAGVPAWYPYEVWLHQIRRPQQGRDGTVK